MYQIDISYAIPERQFIGRRRAQAIVGGLVGDEALRQAKQQSRIRRLGMQSDGVRVYRLYPVHMGNRAGLLAIFWIWVNECTTSAAVNRCHRGT